ncbi:OmpA family protein [Pseudoxanthomonas sp. 10H]|uniref:OmpA family protein n=1 Tax=Pseudoxanthomonas sp. 10H TaxID=3242729 RepID=UPI003556D6F6
MKLRTAVLASSLVVAGVFQPVLAADDPDAVRLGTRMDALQADPALGRMAAFEQMEARQAIAVLGDARRSEKPGALYVAERRVEIAETAAAAEAARRELASLDLQRSELLLQASRRDAERARQEAERLRIQSQIQAEEAERLRLAAEAEAAARTDVEQTLSTVTGKQTAQLSAARRKEAELARQEAELVSGARLPPGSFESRGEVFTLPGGAFAQGKGALTADGKAAAGALSAYLQIGKRGRVRVDAFDKDAKVAQARADAVKAALVAGGVPAAQVQASGKKAGASAKKAAEVIVAP